MNARIPAPRSSAGPSAEQDQRLVADWQRHLEALAGPVRELLAGIDADAVPAAADHFYGVLLDDPRASRYLSPEQVRERLKPSLQRWLRSLLGASPADLDTLFAQQQHVGHVHARIGVPVDLVYRGGRLLKQDLYAAIRARAPDGAAALDAILALDGLLDVAFETMSRAYARSREDAGAVDGSFRLFSLIQNIGTERERQRALLLAWENAVLYALTADQPGPPQPLLISRSEFGLWFLHKGLASFGDTAETRQVGEISTRIDDALRERLPGADPAARRVLLEDLRTWAEQIRSLMAMLFEGIGDLESGRDALTRLLNRRFLPTILRREISLHANTGRQFAVLMLDLDHFKAINDSHGHETGDRALQHVASLLVDSTRGSDYLFRYGGEEFVVVLGSVGETEAMGIAEGLRRAIADSPLPLAGGARLALTASIGVALQDGHPDYERVLARADAAMYQAKRSGRDRVVLATRGMPEPPGARALRY